MTLQAEKAAFRDDARQRRAGIDANAARNAAAAMQRRLLSAVPLKAGLVVGAYWPLSDEIDVRPVIGALFERGYTIALPVVVDRRLPLIFRAWQLGDPLERSVLGTSVPPSAAEVVEPGALLVPALAIDDAGYRLGYGGGYYDRTIAHLRAARQDQSGLLAIGVCFDCQRVAKVPRGPTDERLDWIVTESGATRIL